MHPETDISGTLAKAYRDQLEAEAVRERILQRAARQRAPVRAVRARLASWLQRDPGEPVAGAGAPRKALT